MFEVHVHRNNRLFYCFLSSTPVLTPQRQCSLARAATCFFNIPACAIHQLREKLRAVGWSEKLRAGGWSGDGGERDGCKIRRPGRWKITVWARPATGRQDILLSDGQS